MSAFRLVVCSTGVSSVQPSWYCLSISVEDFVGALPVLVGSGLGYLEARGLDRMYRGAVSLRILAVSGGQNWFPLLHVLVL